MLKVNKIKEPKFLVDFKRKVSIKSWKQMNEFPKEKRNLRDRLLIEEQNYYCPYCEIKLEIDSEMSIEHIKPKDLFPNLLLEYNNLIVSCKTSNTCDQYKKNNWNEKFIDPVKEDPENYLEYNLFSGEIQPKNSTGLEYERAKYTIDILNLNSTKLVQSRKRIVLELYYCGKDYLDSYDSNFPNLIKKLKLSL